MSTAAAAVEKPRPPAERPKVPPRHKPLSVALLQTIALLMVLVGAGLMSQRTDYGGLQGTVSFVGGILVFAVLAPRWAD